MTSAGLAVVTGASRGIGRASALLLAERGLRICLLGRDSAAQRETRALCARATQPVSFFETDFADLESVERAGLLTLRECGVPSVLIHNAGVITRAPVEDLSVAAWNEQIAVNLSAPFALTRALLPAMREQRQGRIVFVASISSTLGTARHSAYCAAKWGIIGFMKSLAEELHDSGLMTAAVLPGSVDTRMLEGSGFPARMSPDDVARTIAHYALDAPLAHNGASIEMFGT